MKRLCTIGEYAKLTQEQRDAGDVGIATTLTEPPEFGESGRLVRYTFSTPAVARDFHTVAADAWQVRNFLRNPVFLWFHDDSQPPIGRVIDIGTVGDTLKGTVEYADADLNPFADMIYRMVKARYINAVSVSWLPIKGSLTRDKSRPEGIDFTEVEMLEVSQVPLPALPSALAEARAAGIDTSPLYSWAEKLLDTGDMIVAPRAELEILRRAAKMSTKRNTLSRQNTEEALKAKHARALKMAPKIPALKRGMHDLQALCSVFAQLGYCLEAAEYEAALEGDNSPLPDMLGDAAIACGNALKAMASEEVNEVLDAHELDGDDLDEENSIVRSLTPKVRAHIAEAKTTRALAWRTGIAVSRAGKELSVGNQDHLEEAQGNHDRALKKHNELGEHHEAVGGKMDAAQKSCVRATSTLSELGEHLRAAAEDPAKAKDHLEAATKAHGEVEKHLGGAAKAHTDAKDRHADADECHSVVGRKIKSARRCVRAVLSGAVTSEAEEPAADDTKKQEASKEEQARAARIARAAELARKEPITLTLD